MSVNKAPFITAGTASGTPGGCQRPVPPPAPAAGKGRTSLPLHPSGFLSFLFAPGYIAHLPLSITAFPPQGTVASLGVTMVPCATATPCPGFHVTIL